MAAELFTSVCLAESLAHKVRRLWRLDLAQSTRGRSAIFLSTACTMTCDKAAKTCTGKLEMLEAGTLCTNVLRSGRRRRMSARSCAKLMSADAAYRHAHCGASLLGMMLLKSYESLGSCLGRQDPLCRKRPCMAQCFSSILVHLSALGRRLPLLPSSHRAAATPQQRHESQAQASKSSHTRQMSLDMPADMATLTGRG